MTHWTLAVRGILLLGVAACGGTQEPVEAAPPPAPATLEGVRAEAVAPPRVMRRSTDRSAAYEVILHNGTSSPLLLSDAELLGTAGPVASWAPGALAQDVAILVPDSARVSGLRRDPVASGPGAIAIPAGLDAVLYLWASQSAGGELPDHLTLRVDLSSEGQAHQITVAETIIDGREQPVVAPPLQGGGWLVVNAPMADSPHRRALFRTPGGYTIAQRYAIDLVRLSREGSSSSGDPTSNESYHAWDTEVLAVGDGVVRAIHDGVPENVPGGCPRPMDPSVPCERSTAVPMTAQTLAGNTVVLEIAPEVFAVYAHLRPGSIVVREGEQVSRGQVLARLGNSGNSTEPHLHLHFCDRPSVFDCQGIPFGFEQYLDQTVDPQTGPTGAPAMRQGTMPSNMTLLYFPPFPDPSGQGAR